MYSVSFFFSNSFLLEFIKVLVSNGLEIILQNQSFTTVGLSTDLQFETAQKVCGFLEWIYLFLIWHGLNCGRIMV